MERLVFALVALGGIAIAAASKRLARGTLISNLEFLGIKAEEGSSRYRILMILTRILVVATGLLLLVTGAMHLINSQPLRAME